MAYRFETDETFRDGFARCAREQLERAVHELTDGVEADPVEAVHEARKALKMERSLLRLGRAMLKPAVRRRENAELREAAGRLSAARDADVMLEALDDLAEHYVGQVPEATFEAIRARLRVDRDAGRARLESSGAVRTVADELRSVAGRIDGWSLRRAEWPAIEAGVRRSYERGQRALRRARSEPTTENLHDWRKRAKDLWYHLRLLEAAAPLTLGGQIEEAHALTDLLGDDHDLAVLHGTLTAIAPDVAVDVGPVLALVEHRRARLQGQAWAAGQRVYAESAKAFTRRLRRYWTAAREEARVSASEAPADLAQRTQAATVV